MGTVVHGGTPKRFQPLDRDRVLAQLCGPGPGAMKVGAPGGQ